jgi:uncharacterized protein YjbI with pentapeptide repeats
MHHATRAKYIRPVTAGRALASFTGQQMTGQQMTGQRMTGQRMTGQQMTGQRITGQRITGQRMTGQRMTGPRIKKAPRLSGAMGQDLRAQLIIYIIPVFILI